MSAFLDHARNFIVEVMGRRSPAIALHVGVCTGAENIVFPSKEIDYDRIAGDIKRGRDRVKKSSIIICAEGDKPGLSYTVKNTLESQYGIHAHVAILGHVQRGGNPTAIDRFIASRMGFVAIESLINFDHPVVTGYIKGSVETVPFQDCLGKKVDYLPHYFDLVNTLSI